MQKWKDKLSGARCRWPNSSRTSASKAYYTSVYLLYGQLPLSALVAHPSAAAAGMTEPITDTIIEFQILTFTQSPPLHLSLSFQ